VSTDALARAARALDLGACMRLDRSLTGARRLPASVLAGVFEAVTGALYLDGGYEAATRFVLDALADELEQATAEVGASNYKSVLQERVQIDGGPAPVYRVVEEFGPDHRKLFHVEVTGVDGLLGRGVGGSKKIAEQSAAEDALRLLDERRAQAEDGSAQE
jgi:ribonuclease-3